MANTVHRPSVAEPPVLDDVGIRLVEPRELKRFDRLLDQHHSLGAVRPAGERFQYLVTTATGTWLALLLFCAAARHLMHRDIWIGGSEEQRRRRRSLITNNTRLRLLPVVSIPKLATQSLSLAPAWLSADRRSRNG